MLEHVLGLQANFGDFGVGLADGLEENMLGVDAILLWMELTWAAREASPLRVTMYLPAIGFLALETVRREAIEEKRLDNYRRLRPFL